MKDVDLFAAGIVESDRSGFAVAEFPAADTASSQSSNARSLYRDYGKRLLDLTLVILSAPVWVWLILVLAVIVMLDGGKPFFGHERVGRDGRVFRCWKLRTMVPDAEKRLADHLAKDAVARREWETEYKLTKDPRITRLGSFLRKSSLDELPQLWNVLVGQMSLVGPRPVTTAELPRYGSLLQAYLAQRPGVTGKWQVGGRNAISYAQRVEMDATYLRECSLMTDVRLILATLVVMCRRTGL